MIVNVELPRLETGLGKASTFLEWVRKRDAYNIV